MARSEEEANMQPGDIVAVRGSGRHARIVETRGNGFVAVEYLPDPAGDALDRDTVQSDQEAGIYREADLELLETP
jgi:hypothetical protein